MKKILVIGYTVLFLLSVVGFALGGGFKMIELVLNSVTAEKGKGELLWRSFLPGWTTKAGVESLNGFWAGRYGNEIWLWTGGGIKSYRVAKETTYLFTDICSELAAKRRILYGFIAASGSYLRQDELEKQIRIGDVVSLRIRTTDGMIESVGFSNANYYLLMAGEPIEKLCDQ